MGKEITQNLTSKNKIQNVTRAKLLLLVTIITTIMSLTSWQGSTRIQGPQKIQPLTT
jgi:hypothetical protein